MTEEYVVLVDENDQEIGQLEKIEAHRLGKLHRAFSILIFNDRGELLLQQRAADKYHSPLLWTNTCCSHPRPQESVLEAANRRLQEEMGLAANLQKKFHFLYEAKLDQGLSENELDHVFIGYSNLDPSINPKEVQAFKWISLDKLEQEFEINRNSFTIWFQILFKEYKEIITKAAHESM
jgi:isopentenyl-diphosphate delta-isomerase